MLSKVFKVLGQMSALLIKMRLCAYKSLGSLIFNVGRFYVFIISSPTLRTKMLPVCLYICNVHM